MNAPAISNNMPVHNTYDKFKHEATGKKCILYGINRHMEQIVNFIKDEVEVSFIADNDCAKWGSNIGGYEVKSPQFLFGENPNEIIILNTTIHVGPVEKFFSTKGVSCYSFFLFFDLAIHLDFYDSVYLMFKNSHLL